MAITDIRNFVPIDDRLGTAGQPTEEQLRDVAAEGYAAVINLGLLDPKYCLPDEAGLAASLGMAYRHIPVRFDAPAVDDFRAFVALWGELRLGWSRARADELARRVWEPNETWLAFIARCRAEVGPT